VKYSLLPLALILAPLFSDSQAASVTFSLSTDSVFKSSSGTPLATGLEGQLGYFAASSAATTAYTDSEIVSLVIPGSTATAAMAALDAKFFSLGTVKFGVYINTSGAESPTYAGDPVSAGTFIRDWNNLNTKPSVNGVEMGGLKPYLYVKTASEYLVIGAEAAKIPTGVDLDSNGSWPITGVPTYDPGEEVTYPKTARLIGSLGSFDSVGNSFSTIPEPSSRLLFVLGLPIMVALRRFRNGGISLS
jgi:hypothetical protein